jgi:4-alpha-glucanotransferase
MQTRNYEWWIRRFANTLELVDLVRIDHFRGFEAYWEIPASEDTAVNGEWKSGPGADLFRTIEDELGALPVVAEDLGLITSEVTDLMDRLNFPGMAVLQFGFYDAPDSKYLPHNFQQDLVAYTGTHDNNTVVGWWNALDREQDEENTRRIKNYVRKYLDLPQNAVEALPWACIRLLIGSVANTVIFPLQDLLGLGTEARMNKPGSERNNWRWRFRRGQLTEEHAERLRALVELYGRKESAP